MMDVELVQTVEEIMNENDLHFGDNKLTIGGAQSALEEDGWTLAQHNFEKSIQGTISKSLVVCLQW